MTHWLPQRARLTLLIMLNVLALALISIATPQSLPVAHAQATATTPCIPTPTSSESTSTVDITLDVTKPVTNCQAPPDYIIVSAVLTPPGQTYYDATDHDTEVCQSNLPISSDGTKIIGSCDADDGVAGDHGGQGTVTYRLTLTTKHFIPGKWNLGSMRLETKLEGTGNLLAAAPNTCGSSFPLPLFKDMSQHSGVYTGQRYVCSSKSWTSVSVTVSANKRSFTETYGSIHNTWTILPVHVAFKPGTATINNDGNVVEPVCAKNSDNTADAAELLQVSVTTGTSKKTVLSATQLTTGTDGCVDVIVPNQALMTAMTPQDKAIIFHAQTVIDTPAIKATDFSLYLWVCKATRTGNDQIVTETERKALAALADLLGIPGLKNEILKDPCSIL